MSLPGKFSAAVLAGGRSTRMGTDKAFLKLGDEFLLERQLRCLRETGAAELLVSGRPGVNYSGFAVTVVYDHYPEAGPLAGLAAVLKAAFHPLVLVLAVDMPAMTPAMLRKILSPCTQHSGCVPVDQRQFQPLAAAYPNTLLATAERHLSKGQYSMHTLVTNSLANDMVQLLQLSPSERPHFINWNEPSDWQQPED